MITREEFNRLLDAYTDAFGAAVHAEMGKSQDYYDLLTEKAVAARQALERAVFG